MTSNLLNAAQISEKLGVSLATTYRLISTGELRAVKIHKRCIRVKPEDLDEYIAANIGGSNVTIVLNH